MKYFQVHSSGEYPTAILSSIGNVYKFKKYFTANNKLHFRRMFLFINKHLTWLSEGFVDLGQSMHSSTQMNLSRAQIHQERMPETSTLFSEARLKSLGLGIHSVTEL